ncbi:Transmembrane protein 65, partial [Dufourea novaeangliae]
MSRLYHRHRKLCCVNSFLLGKCLSPPLVLDTSNVRRACHSNDKGKVESISGCLTLQQAKELAFKLTSEERDIILKAIQECKSEEDKAKYQRQLAAFRWCNELGRPTKIPSLGDVDATGKYCKVPDDWLLRKYVENVPGPSTKNLILVAIANAIPFIGFGFLDNFIMIIAGDQIEIILNKKFPISTMTAAALGNTVSDIIGIGSVHYVELFAHKIGFQAPKLTSIELNLPKTKLAANVGRVIGVTIGCLIGMSPIPIFNYFHHS